MEEIFITIIGAGVVGCSIAYELSQFFSTKSSGEIVVVEKNERINGENQSSRNSGVIHAGIYYPKDIGPLKAKFCVEGNDLLYNFCKKYNVPHKRTGKIIVAVNELEKEYLDDIYKTSVENGISGIRYLSKGEMKNFEPNIEGLYALFIPSTGIIEPTSLIYTLFKNSEANGAIFLTGSNAVEIKAYKEFFNIVIKTKSGFEEFKTKILINSAGLYSDEIAKMINPESPYEIEPIKGEWAKFYHTKRPNIKMNGMNVYPVPYGYTADGEKLAIPFKDFENLFKQNKITKSLGVHLSPTFEIKNGKFFVGDTIIVGPAYSKPKNKEDYTHTKSEQYFLNSVLPFYPNLRLEDLSLHQTGIRAKLKNYYDFIIERDRNYPNCINLIGIDSPGLTACLSIAKYVLKIVKEIF